MSGPTTHVCNVRCTCPITVRIFKPEDEYSHATTTNTDMVGSTPWLSTNNYCHVYGGFSLS